MAELAKGGRASSDPDPPGLKVLRHNTRLNPNSM